MCLNKEKIRLADLPEVFTVTAHSGAFGTPDNSEEFVKRAVSENCAVLELDVSFRPSGEAVMIHDGNPAEDKGVPLRNAFAIVAGHPSVQINLDLKSVANLPAIDAMLKDFGLFGRAFYTGVGEDWAPIVKENSAVPYYINVATSFRERNDRSLAEKVASRIIAAGGIGINSHYDDVSGIIAEEAAKKGLKVSVWTANTVPAMEKCLRLRPDNITTRHPDVLKKLMERV